MAITLKSTDNVKYGSAETKSTTWRVSGKTGTIAQSGSTGTYYITENFSKTFPGPVEEVTPANNINSYSIKGKTVTCSLKGNQSNTTVSAILTVKYSTSQDVFMINGKNQVEVWCKCKPATFNFDTSKIESIIIDGQGHYGNRDWTPNNGDTEYLPAGYDFTIRAFPKEGYTVTNNPRTLDLYDLSSLTLSDFDPITYTFETTAAAYYTITVPAKTAYITSASLGYWYNGVYNNIKLTTAAQTIKTDPGKTVHYTSITPNSGYTAYYDSSDKFTPDGNGYTVPALKVMPKKPTVTLEIPTVYTVTVTIYNNSPTAAYYHLSMLNNNYNGPIAAKTSVTKTYTYSSVHSSVTATVYLSVNDGVSGADTTNFLGNSPTASATATYNPSTT